RLWPHRFPGAGHFVAALRRAAAGRNVPAEDTRRARASSGARAPRPDDDELNLARDFFTRYLPALSLEGETVVEGGDVYLRPAAAPPLEELRVVRGGWWLGSARKGR